MEGVGVLDPHHKPKQAVFAARDRCGEATDRIRSVRADRFLFVKNFCIRIAPSHYRATTRTAEIIIRAFANFRGEETGRTLAEKLLFSPTRPEEELYLAKDGGRPRTWSTTPSMPKHSHRCVDTWRCGLKNRRPRTRNARVYHFGNRRPDEIDRQCHF